MCRELLRVKQLIVPEDEEIRDLNKIIKLSMVVWVIASISGDQCGTGWLTVALKNLYELFFFCLKYMSSAAA